MAVIWYHLFTRLYSLRCACLIVCFDPTQIIWELTSGHGLEARPREPKSDQGNTHLLGYRFKNYGGHGIRGVTNISWTGLPQGGWALLLFCGGLVMQHKFSRTECLIGPEGIRILAQSRVAVFGVGGVGSFTVEALARAGIGRLMMVDYDLICLTNINRQLHALHSTIGQPKVKVMKERVLDINPVATVEVHQIFYSPETSDVLNADWDYVVDAMDTVSAKVHLIRRCRDLGLQVVSAMGAGNRVDATGFQVADISETVVCPLARAVRKGLRRHGIERGVKVVYSPFPTLQPDRAPVDCLDFCVCPGGDAHCARKNQIPGSISFVPSVVGLLLAGVVVKDLLTSRGVAL